jgi:hypothetical protein
MLTGMDERGTTKRRDRLSPLAILAVMLLAVPVLAFLVLLASFADTTALLLTFGVAAMVVVLWVMLRLGRGQ